jgi:hypothetical protein
MEKGSIIDYLSQFKVEMPEWLCAYKAGMNISFVDIMSGRVAYYPGSGFDGSLMKIGNLSHSVHSYLYVDYGISKQKMIDLLAKPNVIRGYHSIGRIEWNANDLLPNGEYPFNVNKMPLHGNSTSFVNPNEQPYCFTEIMERDVDKDEDWGVKRFAVTFLFADGIASYYQLFCKEYCKAPWIVLLQDHGFGGNYDKFGKGGILDAIIEKNNVRPMYVLCGDNTRIWDGYDKIDGLSSIMGGMHNNFRSLYRLI